MRRMTSKLATISLLPLALAACQTMEQTAPMAAADPAPAQAADMAEPAPLSALTSEVNIPYERFELDNGLTVLVHTDRKTPLVGVTTYYRVGSKHEPRGLTGFAHLFEHLMFGGSENVENFDIPLEAAGSTSTNGSTWYDRTNYVETVPTGALDLALFMESDRMGYLLGAVTQEKLDKQRDVVKNEKRQGDNQPYGLTFYALADGLLPVGHPYRHSTIGSMADLSAASIPDVRKWFMDNYGPNNVVLVLAGDIDVETARPMVERWFGAIPRGPEVVDVSAGPVTLDAPVRRVMVDQVPATRIVRAWTGPALTDPDAVPLAIGMNVLGGLASSRLDNILVRDEQLATSVSAYSLQFEDLSMLIVSVDVKPGVDADKAEARLGEIMGDYLAGGPTQGELARSATQTVAGQISGLERVGGFGGKGMILAEGLLYAGNPGHYRVELDRMAGLTPADVQGAMQRWTSRPSFTLVIEPGERTEDGGSMGGWGDEDTVAAAEPDAKLPAPPLETGPPREFPPLKDTPPVTFPTIERATLSNGIPVTLARRTAVPQVSMLLEFDAGYSADTRQTSGAQGLMVAMLEEGTTSRSTVEIAEEQELLGANISTGLSVDTTSVGLTALTANLAPSLMLMADVVRNPAFDANVTQRVRDQRLAAIDQQLASPTGLASLAAGPLIFGDDHPYGSVGALGRATTLGLVTPDALSSLHAAWIRPSKAQITVVGDVTMEELLPQLEMAFGDWAEPAAAAGQKAPLDTALPDARPRLVVIDRPNSPQSVLLLARALPLTGTSQGTEALELANEVIGSGFLSRLNSNLREDKGWTYGIRSTITSNAGPRLLTVFTPVQSDRTGDSIQLIFEEMTAFPAARGVDDVELQRVTQGNIRNLPNRFETNGQVLGAIVQNRRLGRPDNYYATLPSIYAGLGAPQLNAAAAQYLQPDNLVVIVVGDRKVIDSQLEGLDMEIEYLDAASLR
ncbi:M16 family metallopeptidase [Paraurantiacibacter namhicola]|uniref:Peptidase M16 inactive domain protein n=1 Tax=Paraurantiacibacter namhicola TaxID=645517 RepID=A0A1C7DBF0_9SPHN|nr:pitrilysin family protein [Paraurantiacibacter namhicola]ANU08613.1 Peptidase M16 inactive domain protein [Paraurantiacibacter namhicola]